MASSINLNGSRIYRPGVYGIIDASALGATGVSTGNVAIVGAFPTIKQNAPLIFTSARAVKDFDAEDYDLQQIAKLAFSPSTDARVPGGAGSLMFVNTQTTTQASYPGGKDSGSAGSLSLLSKLYGTKGNRTFCSIAVNAASTSALDITVSSGGTSELYEGLESGVVADFYHEGTELTTVDLSISDTQLLWDWSKDHTFVAGATQAYSALTETVIKSGGSVTMSMTDAGTTLVGGDTVTVTVTGLDGSGAAATTIGTITHAEFVADPAVIKTVTGTWSLITEISYSVDGVAFTGTVKVMATAYDINLASDFSYVGQVVSYIANNEAKGWHADALHTRINKIPAGEIDKQTTINTQNSAGASTNKVAARCDLWHIVGAMASSQIVTATRAVGANKRPGPASLVAFSESFYFTGGSVGATSDADYDASLQAIENSDIQIVIPMSESLIVHKKIISHCVASATAGHERGGYIGVPASTTLANVFSTYSSKLNSRHVAAFAQEIQVEDATGAVVWLAPMYGAVMLAGMQAGTAISTPLTRKRPSVYGTRQMWDQNRDANEAISKGIINLSSDSLGVRVERSVTTHLEDDNPIYSEVSANESVNTSVRRVRVAVEGKIGDSMYAGTAGKIKTVVEADLQRQIKDGVIKAWQNVVLTDLGDRIDIGYEVAAVEPLNFIVLTANVVRIASEV